MLNNMKKYKKIILLAAMTLALTACSNNQLSYDEGSAPKAMDNFKEADIIDRMTDIKNGLTPKMKPNRGSSASEPNQEAQGGTAVEETKQKRLENNARLNPENT